MPEEILAIVIISIAAGTAMSMIRMILGYRERKAMRGSAQGSSLTTSELERMMKRAVEEATEPLHRKIDDLEFEMADRSRSRQLTASRNDLLVDLEPDSEDLEESRVRRSRERT